MHERHVSANERDQQAGRMQRLIKKQLLREVLHSAPAPKTNIQRRLPVVRRPPGR